MCPFGQWGRQLPEKVTYWFLQTRLSANRVGFLRVIAHIPLMICLRFFFLSFLNPSKWTSSHGQACQAVLK